MLIDTDIIVFYMRGNENSRSLINAQSNFNISVVTYMELVQGMRNKDELRILRKAMRQWQTNTIYIDHEISSKAAFYFEQHFLSHSLELADALIAATAVTTGMPLISGNAKHYRIINELELKTFRSTNS